MIAAGNEPRPARDIAEVLDAAVAQHGDRIAYGSRVGGLTFRDLSAMADSVAARLVGLNAKRVAVATGNAPLVPAVLFGAARVSATYVPLNYRLPRSALDRLRSRLEPISQADDTWTLGRHEVSAEPRNGEPAAILYTSGSSAEPKAVVLRHEHLIAAALREPAGAAAAEHALLLAAPPFHLPNVLVTLAAVHTGRRIVPFDVSRFSATEWLDAVDREQITHTVVVPTMLHRIVEEMERTGRRAESLLRLTYGSARMPQPVLERALRLFPATEFSNGYGSTESTGAISLLTPADHRAALDSDDPAVRARLGSVGRALPGVAIKIVGPGGSPARPAEVGEVWVRGPQVSGTYLGHPAAVDAEGWLDIGDAGWVDADGYLFCAGRGLSTIISGGENIAAAEVEDVLVQHPRVGEAAVVGLPDDEWGEVPAAMVSPGLCGPPLEAEELQAWVRDRLGSLKTPRVIVLTDALPRTYTGKILHREVRRMLETAPNKARRR
jgi:acyl-CoA synthetase (AMP-forming)/AMP-acid ligase II